MVDCFERVKDAAGDRLSIEDIRSIVNELNAKKRRLEMEQKAEPKLADIQEELFKDGVFMGNQAKLAAKIERRNRYINFLREKELDQVISDAFEETGNPMQGIQAALVGSNFTFKGAQDSVGARTTALMGEYAGALIAGLRKENVLSQFERMTDELERQVARALSKLNSDMPDLSDIPLPEARKIAKVMHKVQSEALRRENKAGAFKGAKQGYVVRHTHNRRRMIKAGEDQWKASIRDRLDYEKMGIAPDDIDRFLTSVWDALTTGIRLGKGAEQTDLRAMFKGPRNLAKKESASRLLEFKDSDAWYDYDKEFGIGALRESFMQDMTRSARSTALMQKLGTNPEAMLDKITDKVRRQYRDKLKGKDRRKLQRKFDNEIAEVTGDVYMSEEGYLSNMVADIGRGYRAIQTLSKLGGAWISAISDIALMSANRMYQGRSLLDSWGDSFSAVFEGRSTGEKREMADLIGVGLDGQLGDFMSRFNANDDVPGSMTKMMNAFFKLNLLQPWTESNKRGVTYMIARDFANNGGKSFDELPPDLSRLLNNYGIDSAKWDMARKGIKKAADGREYLLPESIADEDTRNLVRLLYVTEADVSVPTPGARERAMLTRGYRPGTLAGESIRFVTQFKSFSVTVLTKVFGRQLAAKEYGNLVNLVVGTTLMGYLSMQTKEILKGREPREASMDTMIAAMLQGGGLGIYGDFLFGQANRFGSGTLETVLGPGVTSVFEAVDLLQRARGVVTGGEEDLGGDVTRLIKGNIPFANLFYTKGVLDYLVWYQLQEMQNPGYLRRMERRIERENNQEYIVPPSSIVATGGGFR